MKLAKYSLEEESLDMLMEKALKYADLTSIRIYTWDNKSQALSQRDFYDQKAEGSPEFPPPVNIFELLKKENKMLILTEDSSDYAGATYEKLDGSVKCEVYIALKSPYYTEDNFFGLILLSADEALKEQSIQENKGLSETLKRINCILSIEDEMARRKQGMFEAAYLLCEIINGKEPYLIGRLFNVAYLAVKIARAMRLSENEVEKLQAAVLMHDLGKTYIDESILKKKGGLTDEERETIRRKVVFSYDIAKSLNDLFVMRDLPDIVLHYQERVDGKGYPNGKKGDEIPLLSRILGTAKAISAMLTNTSYKRAKSVPEVIRELKANTNGQFDKKVVQAAIAVLTDEKKENRVAFNSIGLFATLNIIIKSDGLAEDVAKSIEALENDAPDEEEEPDEANILGNSINIWGNIREIGGRYVFIPIEKKVRFDQMCFQYLKLYINVNERMYRYIPVVKKIYADKMVFSELRLVEDTNAFAIRWLLEGYFVSPSRKAYKVFVTMIGGDFVEFYIFSEELDDNFTQGIIRITFEDGKNSTLPGIIVFSEKMGDKTHFRMKFAGLKESEKQTIFSEIFKKQIEIRAMQNKDKD